MRLKLILAGCVLAATYGLFTKAVVINGLASDIASLDEISFSRQAARVRQGQFQLFFYAKDTYGDREVWMQPIGVYANALIPRPVSHPGVLAAAAAGAVNIALVFLIVLSIGGTVWAAFAAALTLMFMPAETLLIQSGSDAIFPAPFVLLWLYGLLRFVKWDSPRALNGAAAALGVCVYSHPAGPLTALFLWIFTLAMMWRRDRLRLSIATAVFALMWTPAAAWFFLHPDSYADTFGRWFVFAAHVRNPLDGLRAFFNPNTLGLRMSHYWGFWDPSWLFFPGDSLLLLIAAPLVLLAVCRPRAIARNVVVVVTGAMLIAPLAGASFGEPAYIKDAGAVLPLVAILAGLGVEELIALIARRKPFEDEVTAAPVDGWNAEDMAPRG